MNIEYRFLSSADFRKVYQASLAAFVDYVVPLQMTEDQFENHIAQNAVELERSVGAFYGANLVGYSLNGFGVWNDKKTVYDAGTGVIPAFRNRGVATAMFDFLLPRLKKNGIEQMLLEVMSDNERALNLYRKLGFRETRKLLFFQKTENFASVEENGISIRQMENPDWNLFKTFWDRNPSWQFSSESIDRKISPKIILGAFSGEKCVGYCVFYTNSGVVSQIGVDKNHRRKSVGSMLLAYLCRSNRIEQINFWNVDARLASLVGFVEKLKFTPTISQTEMILPL